MTGSEAYVVLCGGDSSRFRLSLFVFSLSSISLIFVMAFVCVSTPSLVVLLVLVLGVSVVSNSRDAVLGNQSCILNLKTIPKWISNEMDVLKTSNYGISEQFFSGANMSRVYNICSVSHYFSFFSDSLLPCFPVLLYQDFLPSSHFLSLSLPFISHLPLLSSLFLTPLLSYSLSLSFTSSQFRNLSLSF